MSGTASGVAKGGCASARRRRRARDRHAFIFSEVLVTVGAGDGERGDRRSRSIALPSIADVKVEQGVGSRGGSRFRHSLGVRQGTACGNRSSRSPRASASMATDDSEEAGHGRSASAARSACAKRRASDGTCPGTRPQSSALALHRRCRQCAAFSRKLSTATGAFASSPGWAISRFVMSVTAVGVAKGGCASARRRGRASSLRASASMATGDTGEGQVRQVRERGAQRQRCGCCRSTAFGRKGHGRASAMPEARARHPHAKISLKTSGKVVASVSERDDRRSRRGRASRGRKRSAKRARWRAVPQHRARRERKRTAPGEDAIRETPPVRQRTSEQGCPAAGPCPQGSPLCPRH